MRRIIVKEGPLVFIRNVVVMESVAAILLYAVSFLENYELLYLSLGFVKFLRYDLFLIVLFSSFQLIYVTLLFLDWYFTHFEINDKEVIKKSGLVFRRQKSVNLTDVVSVEIYNSPLGRMMHHATLILNHRDDRVTKIKNIANAEEYAHVIKQMTRQLPTGSARQVSRIIEEGENQFVEFKETLRFDGRKKETSRDLEKMCLKTIVAFLNSEGGTLLIGVADSGEVVGLERDYNVLVKKNRDGFENHLSMLIKTMIGLPFAKYVAVSFEKINNFDVCVVAVNSSHRPAYLKNVDNKEDFFVRVGNSTQPFSMSETEEYIKTKWK